MSKAYFIVQLLLLLVCLTWFYAICIWKENTKIEKPVKDWREMK